MDARDPLQFYKTHPQLAHRVIRELKAFGCENPAFILEPSAGEGHLADAIKTHFRAKVECIEIDPARVAVLRSKGYTVLGHDWLTYAGVRYHDCIVINPPFGQGAEHVLKAWDYLHAGFITALLNAETWDNPYTDSRDRLKKLGERYGRAQVIRLDKAFPGVDANVILLLMEKTDENAKDTNWASMWTHASEERARETNLDGENLPVPTDEVQRMVAVYEAVNHEVNRAMLHIRQAARLAGNLGGMPREIEKMLSMSLSNRAAAYGEFASEFRHDAWAHALAKTKFSTWMDSKQQEEMLRGLKTDASVPFTAENIQATLENVFQSRRRLFKESCFNVFARLTDSAVENSVHGKGYLSNSPIMVNKRLCIPYTIVWCKIMNYATQRYGYRDMDLLTDLDRCLAVLAGIPFAQVTTVGAALQAHVFHTRQAPAKVESQFFKIRWYKNGAIHLYWKDLKLMEAFNKSAADGFSLGPQSDERRA